MPADSISAGVLMLSWGVLSWGATYFVHSTCLIAGIWLFARIRRTAGHALRETLWKTALIGGVVTASAQMWLAPVRPFGDLILRLEGIGLTVPEATAAPAAKGTSSINAFDTLNGPDWGLDRRLADELPPIDLAHDSNIATLGPNAEIATTSAVPATARLAPVQSPAASENRLAYANLAGAWVRSLPAVVSVPIAFAIAAIMLGITRCGWQTILLRRKLARCQLVVAGPARKWLDELLRMVPRAPKVLLLSGPDDTEPAAFGIARWTIVLPPRAARDLSDDELRALLAHELAHLVRGDSSWLCLSRLLCSCLAFQPLNHLARREWQRTAEFLCDNWAVSRTGAPLALARCLTEVAGWRLVGPASTAILAVTGRKGGLVDRIERLLDARPILESRSDRRRTVFAGAVVLAILAWCAPRVQLVASSGENEAVIKDTNLTDAAKSQARDERQVRHDELHDQAHLAANANTEVRADSDKGSILEALDGDLIALESELEQLGPLLHEEAVPQAVSLARRLRGEIVRMKQRREMLKMLSRKPVN